MKPFSQTVKILRQQIFLRELFPSTAENLVSEAASPRLPPRLALARSECWNWEKDELPLIFAFFFPHRGILPGLGAAGSNSSSQQLTQRQPKAWQQLKRYSWIKKTTQKNENFMVSRLLSDLFTWLVFSMDSCVEHLCSLNDLLLYYLCFLLQKKGFKWTSSPENC